MIPRISEEEQPMWNFFVEHNLTKIGYYPICKKGDSVSPMDSKFGGSIFYLPDNCNMNCTECNACKEVLFSVNLRNAPEAFRNMFPAELRESLVQFLYCTECMSSNEENTIQVNVFSPDQFDKLLVKEPKEGSKIEPTIIERWEEFVSVDGTSEKYFELLGESGLDDLEMEEFVKDIKDRYAGKTYLLGFPYFQEGEYQIEEDDYNYIMNIENDDNFSMMLGDAGVGQIWMTPSGKFNFTYM